jgi:hypothetical protein
MPEQKASIYRAIRASVWHKDRTLAFILRPRPKDKDGLSILLSADCREGYCAANELFPAYTKCYGEFVLPKDAVEGLTEHGITLRVVPDEEKTGHANIVGLPQQEDGEAARNLANRFATILAELVQVQHERRFKLKKPK